MATTALPADDMSITVAPASVVLVYKPRSRRVTEEVSLWGESSPGVGEHPLMSRQIRERCLTDEGSEEENMHCLVTSAEHDG